MCIGHAIPEEVLARNGFSLDRRMKPQPGLCPGGSVCGEITGIDLDLPVPGVNPTSCNTATPPQEKQVLASVVRMVPSGMCIPSDIQTIVALFIPRVRTLTPRAPCGTAAP
jgi:hypothetical protein